MWGRTMEGDMLIATQILGAILLLIFVAIALASMACAYYDRREMGIDDEESVEDRVKRMRGER